MTVLVVDDQEEIVQLVKTILEAAGYTVVYGYSAEDGFDLIEKYPEPIHLLLTDIRMSSGADGYDLADAFRKTRPDVKVIYMSGFTDDKRIDQETESGKAGFMFKPFTRKHLLKKMSEMLGQK